MGITLFGQLLVCRVSVPLVMMFTKKVCLIGFLALLVTTFFDACVARKKDKEECNTSCGRIQSIRHPFRLKGDPSRCGSHKHELSCEDNGTALYLHFLNLKYYVLNISYADQYDFSSASDEYDRPLAFIQLVDVNVARNESCVIPRYPAQFPCQYYSYEITYYTTLVKCTEPVYSPRYIEASPCINSSSATPKTYYYFLASDSVVSDIRESCIVQADIPTSFYDQPPNKTSIEDIHRGFQVGVELTVQRYPCYYLPWFAR